MIVPPGLRRAVDGVTKRPVDAERATVRVLLVPRPTRSVVVLPGHRAVVALLTNRPVEAERLTDLAIGHLLVINDLPRRAAAGGLPVGLGAVATSAAAVGEYQSAGPEVLALGVARWVAHRRQDPRQHAPRDVTFQESDGVRPYDVSIHGAG